MKMEKTDPPAKVGSNDQLNPLPEWALIIAAQCWYEPTTSMIELDSRLALVFAEKLAAERQRWVESCQAQYALAIGRKRHQTADAILCILQANDGSNAGQAS